MRTPADEDRIADALRLTALHCAARLASGEPAAIRRVTLRKDGTIAFEVIDPRDFYVTKEEAMEEPTKTERQYPTHMAIWRPAELRALRIASVEPIHLSVDLPAEPKEEGEPHRPERIHAFRFTFEGDGIEREPFTVKADDIGEGEPRPGAYFTITASGRIEIVQADFIEGLYRKA